MYKFHAAGVTPTMRDYEEMEAMFRDDLILLRSSLEERQARLDNKAIREAQRNRGR